MRAGSVSPTATAPGLARALPWALALALLPAAGCSEQNMVTQPKYTTFQATRLFADGKSARPIEPGTVARGQLRVHPAFDAGAVNGFLIGHIPLKGFDPGETLDAKEAQAARKATLERGQQRYNIYCSPCHAQTGLGNGIIVQRGFPKPPSFHEPRLREAPPGHFFHVITNGYGAMYSYASRVQPADRWAIVAYIRALQLSQNATPEDVPAADRGQLAQGAAASTPTEGGAH